MLAGGPVPRDEQLLLSLFQTLKEDRTPQGTQRWDRARVQEKPWGGPRNLPNHRDRGSGRAGDRVQDLAGHSRGHSGNLLSGQDSVLMAVGAGDLNARKAPAWTVPWRVPGLPEPVS